MIEHRPFFNSWSEQNKDFWVSRMQEHQDADRLTAGSWFKRFGDGSFKGCFFGCALETKDDALEWAARYMGLPLWLIHLAEKIYENLPVNEMVEFPVKLLKSIPTGIDLDIVRHQVAVTRLENLAEKNPSISKQILNVAGLHKVIIAGGSVPADDWIAAWSVTESTGREAAWAAASWAAESAVWSAEYAAEAVGPSSWLGESEALISAFENLQGTQGAQASL